MSNIFIFERWLKRVTCALLLFFSSTTWWTCPSHQKLLLLAYWLISWTIQCTKRRVRQRKTEASRGGTSSGPSRVTQEVRNSTLFRSISTSISRQYEIILRNKTKRFIHDKTPCQWILHWGLTSATHIFFYMYAKERKV